MSPTEARIQTEVHRDDAVVDEVIDIEEYARSGRRPPRARFYRIRIDREKYKVDVPCMTGRAILALTGKSPNEYMLSQKLCGGSAKKIAPDEKVDFTTKGIEKFMTLALDPTEG